MNKKLNNIEQKIDKDWPKLINLTKIDQIHTLVKSGSSYQATVRLNVFVIYKTPCIIISQLVISTPHYAFIQAYQFLLTRPHPSNVAE